MEKRFSYRVRAGRMALPALFFVFCAGMMFYLAANNDRGLTINGMIELTAGQAGGLFIVLGILSSLFVILVVAALVKSLLKPEFLTVTDTHILIPAPAGEKRIEYADIMDFYEQSIYGQDMIMMELRNGRKASIARIRLESDAVMDEILSMLKAVKNGGKLK